MNCTTYPSISVERLRLSSTQINEIRKLGVAASSQLTVPLLRAPPNSVYQHLLVPTLVVPIPLPAAWFRTCLRTTLTTSVYTEDRPSLKSASWNLPWKKSGEFPRPNPLLYRQVLCRLLLRIRAPLRPFLLLIQLPRLRQCLR